MCSLLVFCESPPQKDEMDYQMKLDQFVKDTLQEPSATNDEQNIGEMDLQKFSELMEMKAEIAKQVDYTGMQNVLSAYQNVRHADYGTSQAAKRSLFQFKRRKGDFELFSLCFDDELENNSSKYDQVDDSDANGYNGNYNNEYGTNDDDYYSQDYDDHYVGQSSDNRYESEEYPLPSKVGKRPAPVSMKTQVNWMQNKFSHGVFVGKLPTSKNVHQGGSEASIISSRLRSRQDPEKGINLSGSFAGFVCRVCSDGKKYEAFIRTGEYETSGIEYICNFQTNTKANTGNKSRNKFATVRLPFTNFHPVVRCQSGEQVIDAQEISFDRNDVRHIGFRVKSADNKNIAGNWVPFYLSLAYIKVFRAQPEPEFIYLSDARLGDVKRGMVNHELKQVQFSGEKYEESDKETPLSINAEATTLIDENEAKKIISNPKGRSDEELYYKHCGEEMLKNSGLSYSIMRLPELNELASGEFSTLQLKQVRYIVYTCFLSIHIRILTHRFVNNLVQ
jgi:hypothetical protein